MSSERSFDSDSMARRLRGLASIGSLEDRRLAGRWHHRSAAVVHTVGVPRSARFLAAVVLVLSAAAACSSDDGRELPPPDPATTTSTSTRSEEHTSELQSLMRTSYAVLC